MAFYRVLFTVQSEMFWHLPVEADSEEQAEEIAFEAYTSDDDTPTAHNYDTDISELSEQEYKQLMEAALANLLEMRKARDEYYAEQIAKTEAELAKMKPAIVL